MCVCGVVHARDCDCLFKLCVSCQCTVCLKTFVTFVHYVCTLKLVAVMDAFAAHPMCVRVCAHACVGTCAAEMSDAYHTGSGRVKYDEEVREHTRRFAMPLAHSGPDVTHHHDVIEVDSGLFGNTHS